VTTLIATRCQGSHQGESHGGVYLVDFERQSVSQVIDWNSADIDWQGRGWDRGLRVSPLTASACSSPPAMSCSCIRRTSNCWLPIATPTYGTATR